MNTLFILFFIFIVFGISYYLYFKINPSKSSNIKELYSEGLDMLVSGKRFSAYNNFKEIIEKDSNNVMAYLRLGQILRENGNNIKCAIHYPKPFYRTHAYEEYNNLEFEIMDNIEDKLLSLPMYPELEIEKVYKVCDTINKFK